MEEYRFERLTEKNLFNLIDLYRKCFNATVDLSFLQKKYQTAEFGASFVGYLAFSQKNNEAAAYYGVFPIRCQEQGRDVRAAQSGDTMTHPAHQGKGLFIQLARLSFQLAKEEGIEFVFGFPNKNSHPGFVRKLNWSFYGEVNTYVIKTGAFPIDKLAKKFPFLNGAYQLFAQRVLRKHRCNERFENSLFQQDPSKGAVCHNAAFYNYKGYYPYVIVKLKKTTCVLKLDGRMWVGDISYCNETELLESIDELLKLARKLACSSVHFSLFKGSFYDEVLGRKYSASQALPVGYLNLHERPTGNGFMFQGFDFDTF